MCRLCQQSTLLLMKKNRMTFAQAMAFLWHFTPFPVDGEHTLKQVRRFLSVARYRRARWLRKQDRRFERALEAPATQGRAGATIASTNAILRTWGITMPSGAEWEAQLRAVPLVCQCAYQQHVAWEDCPTRRPDYAAMARLVEEAIGKLGKDLAYLKKHLALYEASDHLVIKNEEELARLRQALVKANWLLDSPEWLREIIAAAEPQQAPATQGRERNDS